MDCQKIKVFKLDLYINKHRIILKLKSQGFCIVKDYKQGQIKPKGKIYWINLGVHDIILRYKGLMLGIFSFYYYFFSKNKNKFQFIKYILLHSCARLIARKLKMNSVAKVFKMYGSNLTIKFVDIKSIFRKLEL